jgi:hypothetical protein
MRECVVCFTKSEDHVLICPKCGSDLQVDSVTARALNDILANPRATGVFIAAPDHACPACRRAQGTFYKGADRIPQIPIAGCSCADGCTCRYEPLVVEVGP